MGEGFCSNCGKRVATTDTFCGSCGSKLVSPKLTSASGTPRPRSLPRARVLIGSFVTFLIVGGGLAGFVVPEMLKPPPGTSGVLTRGERLSLRALRISHTDRSDFLVIPSDGAPPGRRVGHVLHQMRYCAHRGNQPLYGLRNQGRTTAEETGG